MAPKEQVKLLETWKKDLFEELSISEIMAISKKKTKPWVFNSLKKLTKEKLLIARRKANLNLYRLNMDNPFLVQTLQYLDADRHFNYKNLDIISGLIKNIPLRNYSLLTFEDKLCFLVENKEAERKIKLHIDSAGISANYITFEEFINLLLSKGDNISKKIFSEHKLFWNADIYYGLIKEAHMRGFRMPIGGGII